MPSSTTALRVIVLTLNGKSHTASVIDPQKIAVVDTIALPGKPEFAVSDGDGHIYVNIEDVSKLVEIDSRQNKVLARVATGSLRVAQWAGHR